GSLVLSFAVSCNSVFGPLAVEVGGPKLVAMANAFGFNETPTVAYPVPESVTPAAKELTSPLDLGVAGIGQGGVEATPLQMASVGAPKVAVAVLVVRGGVGGDVAAPIARAVLEAALQQ